MTTRGGRRLWHGRGSLDRRGRGGRLTVTAAQDRTQLGCCRTTRRIGVEAAVERGADVVVAGRPGHASREGRRLRLVALNAPRIIGLVLRPIGMAAGQQLVNYQAASEDVG